ncbi:calcium-dependent phosphotriesterase [Dendrothele bispora CBS 962.96]|uniref:Calcium-dependent phosphotriesterase n=1 Tax=Dendrothele bispora (strain CBS 962.96) TaxID=1314807 RepID=A0A4S8M0R0_DENBC|nr:calcium-dependent phosphotriesterase [Dendrothele bispora CBS 962.96]
MPGALSTILVLLLAVAVGLYQFYLSPLLVTNGFWRDIEPVGNTDCSSVPELKACEKLVLHQATGVVYLACSTPEARPKWIPGIGAFEENAHNDYVATYDPSTGKVTRLNFENFDSERGFASHGMDVVPSATNSDEIFVYLVNHRSPLDGKDPRIVGADSVIEIFKTKVGSSSLAHVTTVEDPVISTPNDLIGYPDGKSFYFTNDHGSFKTGALRTLRNYFTSIGSVGYCHVEHGCSLVVPKIHAANGIAKAQNNTIYVAATAGAAVSVFERQEDNSLVLTDVIPAEVPLDNLSVDANGALWVAGFPKLSAMFELMKNITIPSPTRAVKITVNTGPGAFYGEKYKVEKAFEDDGTIASGSTTVAYDAMRNRLFIHGLAAPALVHLCDQGYDNGRNHFQPLTYSH